ncbi:MAG: PfkB family carbohydrate kinase [Planctomycetota bacterium]|jgi:sugar/nucleoside kinase (ribokinase family)
MSLIVTGSIGIDTVITPTGRANDILGGSCTYFAAAASFFAPVRIVAVVGEDFPDEHMGVFEHFGVDTLGLERRAGSKTFRWTGEYHENMNDRDTRSVDLNVLAEELPPVPGAYHDSRVVFLANTHPGAQMALLESFPDAKLVVADTMDIWINTARAELGQLMQRLDGLVLNDSEARLLTGESNMVKASSMIVDMGPKFVVIKKGEHGCLLNHKDGIGVMHAFPAANVVDPTGAGDSFGGGMMGYLASVNTFGLIDIKRALAYGTIVASYNIEAFSLERLKGISRHDIDQRLAEYANCVRFD